MKGYIFLYFAGLGCTALAQPVVSEFSSNNFIWHQSTSGLLFCMENEGSPGFEIPIGSGNHTVFSHSLWIAGLDAQSEVRLKVSNYCTYLPAENCEHITGPLTSDVPNPPEIAEAYERFWSVTQTQIDLHNAYYDCVNDTDCEEDVVYPNGYDIPPDFLDWPAHGDTELGYSAYLAPFYDRNEDGAYDPYGGDHPIVCGDFATYIITNDMGTAESNYAFPKMGVEIHTQVYGYTLLDPALQNALFVQHKIINRSDETFDNVFVGNFTDFDLGNYLDDYIGTDVQRSMYFAFNGDDFDEASILGPGYGEDIPALGVKILGGPFADSDGVDNVSQYPGFDTYANETSGWGDGIPDNERLGLYASATYYNALGLSPVNMPVWAIHFYDRLQGIWLYDVPQTVGGNGVSSPGSADSVVTRYLFFGDSDPLLAATDGIDPNYELPGGWTEANENNPPGDRRMIGSSGPFTFGPGEVQYFDYAMVFAQQSYHADEDVVETLKRFADEIVGMECGQIPEIVLSDVIADDKKLYVSLYPNPATYHTTIDLGEMYASISIEIIDVNGRTLRSYNEENASKVQLHLDLVSGIYLVRISADQYLATSRLVKL